jgi:hypothetical protein
MGDELHPVARQLTPALYVGANGEVFIRGAEVDPNDEGLNMPAGETIVKIPNAALLEAAAALINLPEGDTTQ